MSDITLLRPRSVMLNWTVVISAWERGKKKEEKKTKETIRSSGTRGGKNRMIPLCARIDAVSRPGSRRGWQIRESDRRKETGEAEESITSVLRICICKSQVDSAIIRMKFPGRIGSSSNVSLAPGNTFAPLFTPSIPSPSFFSLRLRNPTFAPQAPCEVYLTWRIMIAA